MALKIYATLDRKLTCALKNDMKEFRQFSPEHWKV